MNNRTFSMYNGKLTVGKLKKWFSDYINILDRYDEEAELELPTSTYKMSMPMQCSVYGFIDLNELTDLDRYIIEED